MSVHQIFEKKYAITTSHFLVLVITKAYNFGKSLFFRPSTTIPMFLFLIGCNEKVEINLPPARTPIWVGSGITHPRPSPSTPFVEGGLVPYCAGFHKPTFAYPENWVGMYVVLDFPAFTILRASYSSSADCKMEEVDSPRGIQEALASGPRPFSQYMIRGSLRDSSYYWSHAEKLDETTGLVRDTVAIIIGAACPSHGDLKFWTESSNSNYTGTEKISEPLVISIMKPITIKRFEVNPSTITVGGPAGTISWEVSNADKVTLSNSSTYWTSISVFPEGGEQVPLSGRRNFNRSNSPNTSNGSKTVIFTLKASNLNCEETSSVTQWVLPDPDWPHLPDY